MFPKLCVLTGDQSLGAFTSLRTAGADHGLMLEEHGHDHRAKGKSANKRGGRLWQINHSPLSNPRRTVFRRRRNNSSNRPSQASHLCNGGSARSGSVSSPTSFDVSGRPSNTVTVSTNVRREFSETPSAKAADKGKLSVTNSRQLLSEGIGITGLRGSTGYSDFLRVSGGAAAIRRRALSASSLADKRVSRCSSASGKPGKGAGSSA